ncbi:hypothetical protein Scep_017844 [Stephania cephalantha]|uniref:F-box domain-containing protein n=1 Tax=Stephania cephalantha TaxID=152367 RepID=A0AAP0IQA6_9MAGN
MINKEEEEEQVPLHGDLLNTVLSHVPLLHLLSASHVCSGWRRAALSLSGSLSKPWLLLHTRRSGTPARAYDPSSHEWIILARAPPPPPPPRTDPVVARVGPRHVVVAGGTCEFEHDPLAVEVYDLTAGRWDACESMPSAMVGSASATWLSVAVPDYDGDVSKMCVMVMEKRSGRLCSLDAVTMRWEAMMGEVRPEPSISHSVIGFSGARLVMMGIMGNGESGGGVEGVGVWEIRNYCGGRSFECIEIGRMPDEMVGRVRNWSQSAGLVMGRGLGYVYEEEGSGREVVWFEVGEEGSVGEWGTVDGCDMVFDDQTLMDGVVLTCVTVTLDDLRRAVGFDNQRFSVITRQESE